MRRIGKALIAGLAAMGIMMVGVVGVQAAEGTDFGGGVGGATLDKGDRYLKLSEPTITASNIDKLKFSYKVNDGNTLGLLETWGITKKQPGLQVGSSETPQLDEAELPETLPTSGEFAMPDSTKAAVRKAFDNPKIDGIEFSLDSTSHSDSGVPGEDGQPNFDTTIVWFDRSSQGSGSESAPGSFSDVTDQTPHAADIAWLAKTGVAEGYGNGSFGVGGTVLRQDMAAFLHRMSDNVLK